MSKQNDYPSNTEILAHILDSGEGAYLNTDGIRYDLDGQGMRDYLESIGVKTIQNWDAHRNGYVLCENGLLVSTNGHASKTDGTGVPELVNGYKILQAVLFENDRGFALAENPNAPSDFVTWQFTQEKESRDYYWGHYFSGDDSARSDYDKRVNDYRMEYHFAEKPVPHFMKPMEPNKATPDPIKERKTVKKHTDLER